MRRPRSSLVLLFVLSAAALAPGAAVSFASASATCLNVDLRELRLAIDESSTIVVARVAGYEAENSVTLAPEAFLKGAAASQDMRIAFPDPRPRCPLAEFSPGERVLVFLAANGEGAIEWPGTMQVFHLAGGRARVADPSREISTTEQQLVGAVQTITGQYAVPARDAGEDARISWRSTILPLGAGLLLIFAAALVLMRTWHRIDPS